MKQTAVDYLFERLSTLYLFKDALLAQRALQEAKAMEKEQIIDAFIDGYNSGENKALNIPEKSRKQFESGEDYYNQTYKQ